jgi:alpha-L-fucosidase
MRFLGFCRAITGIGLGIGIWASASQPAAAGLYCSEPRAPDFYEHKPEPPSVPFCVNQYSNTNDCDEWTINSYNSDVEAYNSDLQRYQDSVERYVDELNSYLEEARRYAQCEIDALD